MTKKKTKQSTIAKEYKKAYKDCVRLGAFDKGLVLLISLLSATKRGWGIMESERIRVLLLLLEEYQYFGKFAKAKEPYILWWQDKSAPSWLRKLKFGDIEQLVKELDKTIKMIDPYNYWCDWALFAMDYLDEHIPHIRKPKPREDIYYPLDEVKLPFQSQ